MQTPIQNNPPTKIYNTALLLTFLVFMIGLLGYALIGTTSRYMQDDYCYAAILRGNDFWAEQVSSYLHELWGWESASWQDPGMCLRYPG
jgi:hypothetical protein